MININNTNNKIKTINGKEIDNPLIPNTGVPLSDDNFYDSTTRIINATGTNDVRYGNSNKLWDIDPGQSYHHKIDPGQSYHHKIDPGQSYHHKIDPGQFYDDSGLSGINVKPNGTQKIDLGKFNNVFENEKGFVRNDQLQRDNARLNYLAKSDPESNIHINGQNKQDIQDIQHMSLYQIIINIKNAWFNILDNLLNDSFSLHIFTKDNRLFYIGVTVLVFAILMYVFVLFFSNKPNNKQITNIKKIYHIHQYPGENSKTKIITKSQ
jgi:hypothetical protein